MVQSKLIPSTISATANLLIGTIVCPYKTIQVPKTITITAPINFYGRANKSNGGDSDALDIMCQTSSIYYLVCNVYKNGILIDTIPCSTIGTPISIKRIFVNEGFIDFSFESYFYTLTTNYTITTEPSATTDTYTFVVPLLYAVNIFKYSPPNTESFFASIYANNNYPVKFGFIVNSSITTSTFNNCNYNSNFGGSSDTTPYTSASITGVIEENTIISFLNNGIIKASINTNGELSSIQPYLHVSGSINNNATFTTSNTRLGNRFNMLIGGSLGGWDGNAGSFTAPSNGTYLFVFSMFIANASTTAPRGRYCCENINGITQYLTFNQSFQTNGATTTITTCHYLLAGQLHFYFLENGTLTLYISQGHTTLKISKLS